MQGGQRAAPGEPAKVSKPSRAGGANLAPAALAAVLSEAVERKREIFHPGNRTSSWSEDRTVRWIFHLVVFTFTALPNGLERLI